MLQDEEGNVIAGTGGVFRRLLPASSPADGIDSSNYRLTASFRLHQAEAIEFHFGIHSVPGDNGPRYVLRVTREGAVLGERAGDRGEFVPRAKPLAAAIEPERLYGVQLDRQHGYWFALLHGKQIDLVGALPARDGPESPELRLAAEGEAGPAHFADVRVDELKTAR
jgi:hypothetical protein